MSPRRPLLAAAVLGLLTTLLAPPAAAADNPPFRDPGRPLEERVGDLLGRLTLDEKISLLHQSQAAIPRLGVPYHKNGTEALHGVAWSNDDANGWAQTFAEGTVFPQAVGLASTWDPALIKKVGAAVGDEVRGYNAADPVAWGTQVWAPVVNLLRDPRWGRNEEGYSEDPLLTGAISVAYGKGLSGDDPLYLKTAPVLKHYLANNNEYQRSLTSSNLPPRVKHEYDEAAFKPAITADAATGVMGSYNLVNGRPNTVNPDLGGLVRGWTGKTLYNVSDAWAPHALTDPEHYFDNETEAFAATLKAGIDSFTVDDNKPATMTALIKDGLAKGLLAESDIDRSVRNALTIRFRLGQFDPGGGPYGKITKDVVDSPAHRALNRETAGKAMVLLKNAGTLPLDPRRTRNVAVIGPLHDTLLSDWYGGKMPYKVTPLAGIKARLGAGATVTGTDASDRVALKDVASGRYVTVATTTDPVTATATTQAAASKFDLTDWTDGVSTLRDAGTGKLLTGNWGTFLANSDTPSGWFVQQQFKLERQADGTYLIQYAGYETNESWWGIPEHYVTVGADGTLGMGAKADAARFAKEIVTSGAKAAADRARAADAAVVVVGSDPFVAGRENHDRTGLALGESQQDLIAAVTKANPNTVVVLEDSYPTTMPKAQDKAGALLWTTHAGAETGNALADVIFGDVNPAGRLTQTWYKSEDGLPSILDYDITKTGHTYLYYKGSPLYSFGHGLSYTTFAYQGLTLNSRTVRPDGTVTATVKVTNTGRRAGDEVVQLYTHQRTSRVTQPVKQLRAFQRVHLAPGQTKAVTLSFKAADLALWDVTRNTWAVEKSAHDVMVGSSSTAVRQRTTLDVQGEKIPPRDLYKATRAADFDDYAGVELVDETKAAGDAVGRTGAGDWIAFKDADLRTGATGITAGVAATAPGKIEVRLGSPTGKVLGTLQVPSTGGVYTYTTVTAPLAKTGGVRDLYLTFTGDLRLKDLTLTRP
ncbi:beta-glucosidase [Sphaerisporangium melleum]|uniref:Exo-alpha-(1->6)-L-arabinopyranosidase n=1 Tax=Sphaerisporangium melleum TaxID=321316 RepID=A0A917RB74_9ACTN|nr:glycoside hydrolase family 3 protein [Sphaerisporangium melleum]GGK99944.1 beta-glucosidase [Sphaerisporangium melleum]GII71277.1 beta-glucosidase [Sphaerisporangium melleum]